MEKIDQNTKSKEKKDSTMILQGEEKEAVVEDLIMVPLKDLMKGQEMIFMWEEEKLGIDLDLEEVEVDSEEVGMTKTEKMGLEVTEEKTVLEY